MSLKKKIFIAVNAIILTVFISFMIYGICTEEYLKSLALFSSSMLVLSSAINIASCME